MAMAATFPAIDGVEAARALVVRELVRMWRQPTRLIGMLGTVALLWLFIGSGAAGSFRAPGAVLVDDPGAVPYGAYLVPGMVMAAVLFGTVFSAITLIQDRNEGFLRGVLATSAPRWSVVAAKVGGGVVVAVAQGLLILMASPLAGANPGFFGVIGALIALTLATVAVVSMGLALAWWVDSVGGFHGVMNLVLAPMWLLSGALFPAEGATGWLRVVMRLNPLSWSTRAMAGSLGVGGHGFFDWIGALAFAGAMVWLAWWSMGQRRQ